jgi:predicted Zn-dependent protease/DNA uptake protein ComE-like DNA-binding protein
MGRRSKILLMTGTALLFSLSPAKADVLVEIQGAVQRPGTYFVSDHATLTEVIRTAGGLSNQADKRRIAGEQRISPSSSKIIVTIPFINGSTRPIIASASSSFSSENSRSRTTSSSMPSADIRGEWPIGGIEGWDTKKLPIAVWVEPLNDQELISRYGPALDAALGKWNQLWQELSMPKILLRIVNDPDKADIVIRWRRLKKEIVGSNTLGHAVPLGEEITFQIPGEQQQYLWKRYKKAYVELDLYTNDNKFYGTTAMYWIITHEVGHALGLKHTNDPSDLMYPSVGLPVSEEQERQAQEILEKSKNFGSSLAALKGIYNMIALIAPKQPLRP